MPSPLHAMHKYERVFLGLVCRELHRRTLQPPLVSTETFPASPLSPEEQGSNENHLVINWSLEGPMNG